MLLGWQTFASSFPVSQLPTLPLVCNEIFVFWSDDKLPGGRCYTPETSLQSQHQGAGGEKGSLAALSNTTQWSIWLQLSS